MTELAQIDHQSAMSAMQIMNDDQTFDRMHKMASVMAAGACTVPKHLQGNPGDCFAICMQAAQWGMNPFAVAQKTHLVNGTLGYEAQLVNAVIATNAPVQDRLNYEWFGEWSKVDGKQDKSDSRGVRVFATLINETEPRVLEISMAQVGPVRNSPMWVADPRQQIAYLATKRWARLHCPDVMLGVYSADELDDGGKEVDVTPAKPHSGAKSLKEQLAKAKAGSEVLDAEPVVGMSGAIDSMESAVTLGELKKAAQSVNVDLNQEQKDQLSQVHQACLNRILISQINEASHPDALDQLLSHIAKVKSETDRAELSKLAADKAQELSEATQ